MSATARLELSRARLRHAMLPQPRAAASSLRHDANGAQIDTPWIRWFKQLPIVGVAVDAVHAWWAHHPLRPLTLVAREASTVLASPIAQRNPIALVSAAALAGAVIARSRPWRWIFSSALFAGLVPQVAARVVANLPLESWLEVLTSTTNSRGGYARAGVDPVIDEGLPGRRP